jgi:hypothetical protein
MDDRLKQDALIEDALKSQPLAPMPHSVTPDVMARIRTAEAKRPALLTWNDFVLSFVVAACIAALWFAAQSLPPILLAKLRIQIILAYQQFILNARWLIPAITFGLAALLAGLTIPSMIQMTTNRQR